MIGITFAGLKTNSSLDLSQNLKFNSRALRKSSLSSNIFSENPLLVSMSYYS